LYNKRGGALTSASRFEIGATVAELEARVVAVARLVRGVLDDCVDGRLLDDARRVAAGTAQLGFQAAARVRGADQRQEHGRRDTDDGFCCSGTTPHDGCRVRLGLNSRVFRYTPRHGQRWYTVYMVRYIIFNNNIVIVVISLKNV